jgi:transcriptional regulator with XRE-family HTH domain
MREQNNNIILFEENSADLQSNTDDADIHSERKMIRERKKELLAEKIKLKLQQEKIKSIVLAAKLGKSPSEISKWLSGTHNFTIDTLFEIEEELRMKLVDIDPPPVEYKAVKNGIREYMITLNFEDHISMPAFLSGLPCFKTIDP